MIRMYFEIRQMSPELSPAQAWILATKLSRRV